MNYGVEEPVNTEPKEKYGEIRCYIRDPDGRIIELGQSTDLKLRVTLGRDRTRIRALTRADRTLSY